MRCEQSLYGGERFASPELALAYETDFDKMLVSDDLVITGSFNFSKNAQGNAENQVTLANKGIADQYAKYIEALVERYEARAAGH